MIVCSIFYICIVPFIMTGDWCLDNIEKTRGADYTGFFLDCKSVAISLEIPYAYTPTAVPAFTACLDLICLLVFCAIKMFRYKTRKLDKPKFYRDIAFCVLVSISFIDIIVCLILYEKQFVANMLRPFIIVLCYKS